MKKKKKFIVPIIFLGLLSALVITANIYISSSPSTQLLISVVGFSERTLKNPGYLAYNIDLMDLFQNYMNSDITFSGSAYIKKMKRFSYSTSGKIEGQRSFTQKRMSVNSDMSVLIAELGGLDMYAEDETVYMIVPMLDNLAYAFDTEVDLFKKGPSFTSDISREWFHDNSQNFVDFFNSITIEKTDNVYEDEDGVKSYEYKMVIPKGQGQFIWDLLGMDAPKHDIKSSIYLDRFYQTRRIVFDLSESMKGASLVVDGKTSGKCILTVPLPDNEQCIMTIVRKGEVEYTNAFHSTIAYYTNTNIIYTIDCDIQSDYTENGMKSKVSNIIVSDGTTTLMEGYCEGEITKVSNLPDVFKDVETDFSEIEVINWKVIRDDTETFINDLIDQAKKNMVGVN